MDSVAITIAEWLARESLRRDDMLGLVSGLCGRLELAGVPLLRAHVSMPTLHPTIEGFGFTWRRGRGLENTEWGWDHHSVNWEQSPFRNMILNREPVIRRRLDGDSTLFDYPILADMKAEGATDYAARLIPFGEPFARDYDTDPLPGIATSWTTDRPGGFSEDELALIDRLLPFLGLAVYRLSLKHVATSTLEAYIGPGATQRVLSGEIRRGVVTRKPSVVMFADLRGFTSLADCTEGERLVRYLNEHLDCMVGPVERHGGQVLKLLGDGMLAVFPLLDGTYEPACEAALRATEEAIAETADLNDRRRVGLEPELHLDVALHMGEVMYGNVGSARRLDFTMIGPAVNEASRIEALCHVLGHHVLISSSFAKGCCVALRSVGVHALRGVSAPQELFTLA
ncbi:MAG TPA: adenylate/guanylate cyclase domain-containing protein [Azospirillaceae bacterium]|nr:adenylate/guanylate cyclase domain-containing protein [Azospirillaceae bacterium]